MRDKFESITVAVRTPDGKLYYTICEEENRPVRVFSVFGKSGSSLAAWANSVDCLVNMLLERGTDINDIITEIGQIASNKVTQTPDGVKVSSGPAGLVVALLEYKRQKYIEQHLRRLKNEFADDLQI